MVNVHDRVPASTSGAGALSRVGVTVRACAHDDGDGSRARSTGAPGNPAWIFRI